VVALPVPAQRDPEQTCARLAAWLRERLPGAEELTVSGLRTPGASGFSSETLLFEAAWTAGGVPHHEPLVARVAPTAYRLFPDARFDDHCRVMRILDRDTDVPLPRVRWHEPDAGTLGAPFIVMDQVPGLVPSDMPPYHQDGWVVAASPAERERMWWGGLELLARIHRVDVARHGLGFVDRPELGRTGIDQQLGYYERFAAWAGAADLSPVRAALAWLRAEQPAEAGPPRLLWGDARIGNMIFQDAEPRAVLDWEMVTLGQPEVDLAWYLFMDRHHSEGSGLARLAGLPGPAETVARYERLLGRPMRDLPYYELFAALRFAVIMVRLGRLFIEFEMLPPDSEFPADNTATRLLGRILDERC
jgi:aminoglycoside phosphotransferase (APT) family kinase protein